MQKVAWPRTIVQVEKGMSIRLKAERSEMPVMMPGSAIGRMTRSEIASRPKKRARTIAAAQSVPRTSATSGGDGGDADRERERLPDVGAVPGDGEPFAW